MSETPPEVSSAENEPRPRRGVSVPVGIAVAVVTAALTCAVGLTLLGRPSPVPPEPIPLPQPVVESPDGSVDADGAVDGGDGGGDGATDATIDGTKTAAIVDERARPEAAPAPAAAAGESPGGPDCGLADKEIAREAWRRNLPTICHSADGKKTSMYVPVRGSLDNATYGVRRRPAREARVDLPEAESLLTMAQYKLDRDGFVDLKPSESSSGGALLRIRLQKTASDPVFELKEGFIKITVAVPPR